MTGDDQNAARNEGRPDAAVGDLGGRRRASFSRGAANLIVRPQGGHPVGQGLEARNSFDY